MSGGWWIWLDAMRGLWTRLAALVALLILAGPTPIAHPFVSSLRQAEEARSQGEYELALESLERALLLEPSLTELHVAAAEVAMAAGLPVDADRHLTGAEGATGADLRLECLRAELMLSSGMPVEAFRIWNAVGGTCESPIQFLSRTVPALEALDEEEAARAALEAWAAHAPDDPEPLLRLGLHAAVKAPQAAIEDLQTADEQTPGGDPLAQAVLEAIYGAEAAQNQAYTLAQVGQALARLGQWKLAATAFGNALASDPDYVEARAYLGLAMDQIGQDGVSELEAALAQAPEAAFPRLLLGIHWRSNGEPEKALEELQTAARLDPDEPAITAELASTYHDLGDLEAAEAWYRRSTDLAPEDPTFWLLLAEFSVLNEVEVESLGLPAARNAVALSPYDPAGHDMLGYAHFLLGNFSLASRSLEYSLKLAPERALTLYHLGLLRLAQGDPAGAHDALESVLALEPDGSPLASLAGRALASLSP